MRLYSYFNFLCLLILASTRALFADIGIATVEPNEVIFFDTCKREVIKTILVPVDGSDPFVELAAITPDCSKAIVTAGTHVFILDMRTQTVIGHPISGVGAAPFGIAITPNGCLAFIGDLLGNKVYVLDIANTNVIASILVGNEVGGLAITPDGTKVFVTNFGSSSVSVIDVCSQSVIKTISLPPSASPAEIAITPDGKTALVSDFNSTNHRVYFIDTNSYAILPNFAVLDGPNPEGIAISLCGTKAYVANRNGTTVNVIDISSRSTIKSIPGFNDPSNLSLNFTGDQVFVTNDTFGGNIIIIDVATDTVIGSIPTPSSISGGPFGISIRPLFVQVKPPSLSGCQKKNEFLTQTERFNVINITPPAAGCAQITSFKIFRDSGLRQLVTTLPANCGTFVDHNIRKGCCSTYFVVAVDCFGNTSTPACLKINSCN